MTQNINSVTFQPFVLYTAAAGLYVIAAFAIDFVFRAIEKSLDDTAAGPDRPRVATAAAPARRAGRPRLPGCLGNGVTSEPLEPCRRRQWQAGFATRRPHGHDTRRVRK